MSEEKFQFDNLSDREILLLVAAKVNDIPGLHRRVRRLEDWRNYILGALAVVSISLAVVWDGIKTWGHRGGQ